MSATKQQTLLLLIVAMATVAVLAGCKPGDPWRSTGAYPIDIFQEMHYNQSYKAQEPPRFSPPAGSIPITGGFIPAPAKADAADLTSPFPVNGDTLERGALLFRQNCSMCHGLLAQGDGYVGQKFGDYGAPTPPSFDSERIQSLKPGEAYASISLGFGFMPTFQNLLSEEDRWALVALIEASSSERQTLLTNVNNYPDLNGDGDNEVERANRLRVLRGQD